VGASSAAHGSIARRRWEQRRTAVGAPPDARGSISTMSWKQHRPPVEASSPGHGSSAGRPWKHRPSPMGASLSGCGSSARHPWEHLRRTLGASTTARWKQVTAGRGSRSGSPWWKHRRPSMGAGPAAHGSYASHHLSTAASALAESGDARGHSVALHTPKPDGVCHPLDGPHRRESQRRGRGICGREMVTGDAQTTSGGEKKAMGTG
jgi:hypothetical protein